MDNNVKELMSKIEDARAYARKVHETRALVAGAMTGTPGLIKVELEFPEPDTMHVYQLMLGRRMESPTTYRLAFGQPMKWVGISHPWGLKPADIVVRNKSTLKEERL